MFKNLNKHFTEEEIWRRNKHMQHQSLGKCKTQPQCDTITALLEWLQLIQKKTKKANKISQCQMLKETWSKQNYLDVEQQEFSYFAKMNAKWYNYFRKQIGSISLLGIYPEK